MNEAWNIWVVAAIYAIVCSSHITAIACVFLCMRILASLAETLRPLDSRTGLPASIS